MADQEKTELNDTQLDAVAGGTQGAGTLYPGQTETPEPSNFPTVSGLGDQAESFTLKQKAVPDSPKGY